jgi:hypothetical protein
LDLRYFPKIAEILRFHGVITNESELNATNFRELIRDFQGRKGLTRDGLPGPVTNWALQAEFYLAQKKLPVERCEADQPVGSKGYESLRLRADTAGRFRALRDEINASGGVVTTAGGLRQLSASVGPGRSKTSQHYRGGAFDLALSDGLSLPDRDPYVTVNPGVLRGDRERWTVYARADDGEEMELDAVCQKSWDSKAIREVTVRGRFINFTELARKHGFQPIRPRTRFVRDGKTLSAEWWHFQDEESLIPGLSQFGIELNRIDDDDYQPDRLDVAHPELWSERRRVFQTSSSTTPAWW